MFTDIFTITLPILGAGLIIFLFIQNNGLKERIDVAEGNCSRFEKSRDKYQNLWASEMRNHLDTAGELNSLEDSYAAVCQQRDDLMTHLEETLVSNAAERTVPDHISVEVGMNGLYYTFEYDPPEGATITPLPKIERSYGPTR